MKISEFSISTLLTFLIVGIIPVSSNADDLIEILEQQGDYEVFIDILEETGLSEDLMEGNPVTVFAPDDEAFDQLPGSILQDWQDDPEPVRAIIEFHIIGKTVDTTELEQRNSMPSLHGSEVYIHATEDDIAINEATLMNSNIEFSNGILHTIDTVLLPR